MTPRRWLTLVFLLVVAMTAVGGTTRLTGSGLSMVEWRPLMGAVPPVTEVAWIEVFERYRASPQGRLVNDWMTLGDFQRIFFWEYVHRLLGRIIGVAVLCPALWLLVRGRLSRKLALQVAGLLVLGAVQGLVGWIMVRSGLVDVPRVSHLRLATHLVMAFALAQAILWVRLSLDPPTGPRCRTSTRAGLVGLGGLLVVQTAWGAFMAGTRAGLYASTFPDVHGRWWPGSLASEGAGLLRASLFEVGPIHATHRLLAWVVLPAGLVLAHRLWQEGLRGPGAVLGGLLVMQVALGAATVVLGVPTGVAVAHQVCGLLLLSAVTLSLQRGGSGRRPGRDSRQPSVGRRRAAE